MPTQPLRRLSATQYRKTLEDLLGSNLAGSLDAGSLFPPTLYREGFEADAESNLVNTAESQAIEDNAERIAAQVLSAPDRYLGSLLPCPIANAADDAAIDDCIDAFINTFGRRAYRRPLTPTESTIAHDLYASIRDQDNAAAAFAGLLQFFLQSPALLYRVERGAGTPDADGLLRLDDYETASRLSYFLTNSLPDAMLLDAAARRELRTPEQVETQARRLASGPRFVEVLAGFHRDLLHLGDVEALGKDGDLYPDWTPEIQQSLAQETQQLLAHVLDAGDGTVRSLLGSIDRPLDANLASYYGVDAPGATATTWVSAATPDRRGLLTQVSFMAALAEHNRTSPIHRGVFFERELLCMTLPTLPVDLDTQTALSNTADLPTARQRLAPLLTNGQCAGCHTLINPLGLAFENYDAAGRWRDQENGTRIDASGTLEIDGETVTFNHPNEVVEAIAASTQARDCYALQMFRAALGRRNFAEDACSLAGLLQNAEQNAGDVRELLVAVTQSDAFLFRPAPKAAP